ncbi:MAG: M48 family metallopeptidase [Chitinophagales bacterium]|nr:M48 family metallopeptidase [Chitinophagales bacterium]
MDIPSQLRHPKESGYFTIMAVFGGLIWLSLLPVLFIGSIFIIPYLLVVAFVSWVLSLYHKAVLYGTGVRISEQQFPEIYKIAQEQSQEMGMSSLPDLFTYNGNGLVNAFAQKTLSRRYVMLPGDLVDLLLRENKIDELKMIIGHELAHHAAGHLNFGKNLLILPARIIPFISGAYGRACELTADRIGYHVTQNAQASKNALLCLAHGSKTLAPKTNIQAFIGQEQDIPYFPGLVHKLVSTHPRMTRRLIELEEFASYSDYLNGSSAKPLTRNKEAAVNHSEI